MGSPWDVLNDDINRALSTVPQPGASPPPAAAPPTNPLAQTQADIDAALKNPKAPPPPQSWGDYFSDIGSNFNTSVQRGMSAVAGLPHTVAQLGDKAIDLFADPRRNLLDAASGTPNAPVGPSNPMVPPGPGFLTRNLPSPEDITASHFAARNKMFPDQPPAAPYEPQTLPGKVGSAFIENAIPGLLGGPEGAVARAVAGGAGGSAATLDRSLHPDAPWWEQLLANVAGAGTAAGVTGLAKSGYNAATGLLSNTAAKANAEAKIAEQLAKTSGQSGSDLAATIAANQPQWTPGTRPDLGNLTESPGVRGMVYQDTTRAAKQNDPTYVQNASTTAEAQRAAVAGARPADAAANLQAAQDDLKAATDAIPPGLSKQDAGEAFRANLQAIKDQREAARGPAGAAFEALKTDQTPVDLSGVKDYARTQAAQSAGGVGDAYQAALKQLSSATGVTPGTAAFASNARTALNDLASSYGRQGQNAAQRAVLDVRANLDDYLTANVPGVKQAAEGWKLASQPLDVFEAAPFGKALARDQYGRGYLMDNESVVRNFLESPGSSDALDRLHEIFGSPEASSSALQQYIAGKVTNADGSINQAALAKIQGTGPGGYGAALMRFPTLQKQFSTVQGAADAVAQQQAYQNLYNTAENELGTQAQTASGQNVYSADKFNKFVQKNGDMIDQAYTPEQAATVRRVNDELQNISQTVAQGKAPGTSGTAQLMEAAKGHGGTTGAMMGAALGFGADTILHHIIGIPGVGELAGSIGGAAIGARQAAAAQIMDSVRRQALTDPEYARSLLIKFDPSGVNTPAAQQALAYVMKRTPFGSYAAQTQGQ
jgi:hypothetical protein